MFLWLGLYSLRCAVLSQENPPGVRYPRSSTILTTTTSGPAATTSQNLVDGGGDGGWQRWCLLLLVVVVVTVGFSTSLLFLLSLLSISTWYVPGTRSKVSAFIAIAGWTECIRLNKLNPTFTNNRQIVQRSFPTGLIFTTFHFFFKC